MIEADEIKDIKGENFRRFGADFSACELDVKLARKCGRRAGNYLTVQTDDASDVAKALRFSFGKFIKKRKKTLVVGLGNGDVVADALGSEVVGALKSYGLAGGEISVFAPDVGALTNLDSVRLVQSVAEGFAPDYVIAVDALATTVPERIGRCYQFTDSGISPGGGVGKGGLLDERTVRTRFIAVGVPFIVEASCVRDGARGYYVPYDADERVKICARNIAAALYDRVTGART